jgi:hypothetical protein
MIFKHILQQDVSYNTNLNKNFNSNIVFILNSDTKSINLRKIENLFIT